MRKSVLLGILCGTLGVVTASGALAASRNTGGDDTVTASPNVLSGSAAGGSILYAPSEVDDPVYRAAIAAITGGTVDYFDARAATPSLALLQQYSCVHTWANFDYDNNVLFGDNLADYVDAGGRTVLGVFCTFTDGNFLSGRIMTPGYSPVTSPGGNNHFSFSSYAGDGTTSIHTGVTAYGAVIRDFLALQGGGLQDGSYLDGEIAHAYRPDFKVIYSNGGGGFPLGAAGNTGDWPRLIANSCAATNPARAPALSTPGLVASVALLTALGILSVRKVARR